MKNTFEQLYDAECALDANKRVDQIAIKLGARIHRINERQTKVIFTEVGKVEEYRSAVEAIYEGYRFKKLGFQVTVTKPKTTAKLIENDEPQKYTAYVIESNGESTSTTFRLREDEKATIRTLGTGTSEEVDNMISRL